jgi:iron complex transport system substrate-binding protein
VTVSRRLPAVALAALVAVAGLVGCGAGTPPPAAAPVPATGQAFPVSVTHAFGTTVVPAPPQRVVTAGYTEQDIVLALGVQPVGVTEWYGDRPLATWPWATDELGGAKPEVLSLSDGFQFEKIAALRPDLIVAVNAGLEQATYDKLAAIAPTVAQPADATNFFSPWDDQTVQVGAALGKRQEAAELVDRVKGDFAAAAKAHPQFAGLPAIFLQAPFYDGKAIAYQNGLSTEFLTDLGFVVPATLDRFAPPDDKAQAYIPMENLGELNAGRVLVWATETPQARTDLEVQPLYRQLTPVKQGNLVFTDDVLAGAIYFSTPLSLPYVLDELVPRLEKAVAGNPETMPPA